MTELDDPFADRVHVKVSVVRKSTLEAGNGKRFLTAFDGIRKVEVDENAERVTIYFDPDIVNLDHVLLLLCSAGFTRWTPREGRSGVRFQNRRDDAQPPLALALH